MIIIRNGLYSNEPLLSGLQMLSCMHRYVDLQVDYTYLYTPAYVFTLFFVRITSSLGSREQGVGVVVVEW